MGRVSARRRLTRYVSGEGIRSRPDSLAVEEPLELRVNGSPLTVTMRTPGHDVELAHGFLVTEGVITGSDDVATARYCAGSVGVEDVALPDGLGTIRAEQNTYNVLEIALAEGVADPALTVQRNFLTTSACGVCGKASIEATLLQTRWPVGEDPLRLDPELVLELPERLRAEQRTFDRTGGLHAAGLFSSHGDPLVVREDVGRHNAVDKVVGWALLNGQLPGRGRILVVSGRASFELTQKAAMAGIPALVAVSAPSSLAVDVAEAHGMTLLGFVRRPSFNAYAGAHRLAC